MLKCYGNPDPEFERIHDKYGNTFDGIPKEYIEMFEELDTILDKYDELICDYLEDLKAYALMYRNVHIKCNRVVDRIYFAQKAEEIKGFKNKIYSQNVNARAQVLRYYLEYGSLFELYCLKQVGIKMEQIYIYFRDTINNYRITKLITIEEYNNVKRGQLGREFGIVSLSNEQCASLLNNIVELENIINNNNYPIKSFPLYEDEEDFVKNIVIPFYFEEKHWNLNRQGLKSFAEKKRRSMNVLSNDYFEEGKTLIQSFEHKDKISLNYINDRINKLLNDKEKQFREEITAKYNTFINKLSSSLFNNMSNIWDYMFKHQEELQDYLSSFYKNEYMKSMRFELKKSLVHSIDSFVQIKNQYNPTISDSWIERYHRKDGNLSKHQAEARTWATYIKDLIKEREEQKRKAREEQERKRLEQFKFNTRNKHGNDSKISFRESDHIYMVDGVPLDSVTSFVTNCFPKFNANFYAKRKAEELGKRPEEVLAEWEKKGQESRELGTAMHRKIEDYYLGKNPTSDETFDLFRIFANKIILKPYRTEWAVYDWEHKIAGTIDFVDYQNGEYIIYDWKRSSKLIAGNGLPIKRSIHGEKALPPIDHLDDTPYYHYALQLGLYKYILEKEYNIKVSKLRLGIFHPSYNKPYIVEMPYLEDEINTLFGLKSEVIF